jgi:hypothetical protein
MKEKLKKIRSPIKNIQFKKDKKINRVNLDQPVIFMIWIIRSE